MENGGEEEGGVEVSFQVSASADSGAVYLSGGALECMVVPSAEMRERRRDQVGGGGVGFSLRHAELKCVCQLGQLDI